MDGGDAVWTQAANLQYPLCIKKTSVFTVTHDERRFADQIESFYNRHWVIKITYANDEEGELHCKLHTRYNSDYPYIEVRARGIRRDLVRERTKRGAKLKWQILLDGEINVW